MRRFVLLALWLAACSTSKVVINDREFAAHSAIDFENVRFRRPNTPVYDFEAPKNAARVDAAGNVVVDAPKPLGNLDCERPDDFFGKLKLAEIRACLGQITGKPIELEWGLKKEGQPELELRDPKEAPECIRATLGQLPFPREIVYVVAGENPLQGECYTSRLALDPGELLGWELPRAKIRLRVAFPLRETPKSDRELERLLRVWTLSIYRGGSRENGSFHGRFLPGRYCQRCFAATVPPPVSLWPSRPGGESVR